MKNFWSKLNQISLQKLWFTSLILKLFDNGTTYYFVSKLGSGAEGNPLMKWNIDKFGLDVALLVNYIIFAIITFILYKLEGRNVLLLLIAIFSIVVLNNSVGSILIFLGYIRPV